MRGVWTAGSSVLIVGGGDDGSREEGREEGRVEVTD